jgi:hypothetical protein
LLRFIAIPLSVRPQGGKAVKAERERSPKAAGWLEPHTYGSQPGSEDFFFLQRREWPFLNGFRIIRSLTPQGGS